MMLLVSGLEICGFFDLVSSRIAVRAKNQAAFLAWLMVATAALSALVLNDTIALLVTPVVIRSTRALRGNPLPYLVAVAIAANVGSVATEVGNPQNAFIAIRSGIPFLTFTAYLLPVTIACLVAAIGLVWLAFRKDLAVPLTPISSVEPVRLQRPRLAGRSLGAALEPDQQRARGVALGRIAAWLDPTLACTGRKLDAGGERDDPRGRVQRHRRASRIPRRSQGVDEGLREGGVACHRRDARPVDGPDRASGTRVTDTLCRVRVVACRWARRPISPRSGFGWWSDSSPPGTSRIRGCEMRSSRCRGRRSSGPRMRTLPMTTSRS